MLLLFFLQKCVEDTLSPISVRLNFFQVDSESASAVLNMDSQWQAAAEVRTVITAEGWRQTVQSAFTPLFM